jgi:hypothetical protein
VVRGTEPAPALVAYADPIEGAILVLTSPRWADTPSHWFNTTRRVIRRSSRPVLVVPADWSPDASSWRSVSPTTVPPR